MVDNTLRGLAASTWRFACYVASADAPVLTNSEAEARFWYAIGCQVRILPPWSA